MQTRAGSTAPSATAHDVTELILRIFRVNARLLVAGDHLVGGLGLTSARWQMIGCIAAADRPRTVASLARELGVSRQAVQRIANDMSREKITAFCTNPKHKRAQLVVLTDRGQKLFEQALMLQRPWAARLATNLSKEQIQTSCEAMDALIDSLASGEQSNIARSK